VTIRVLIADDQALVRAGFCRLLDSEADLRVVGEAANGVEALDLVDRFATDVVLMDIRMPILDGLDTTRRLATRHPAVRVVILTTHDLDEYVFDAMQAGASGFLLKDSPPDMLIAAVRTAAAGDALLGPTITRRLIEEFIRRPVPVQAPPAVGALTPREFEVLRLLATGLSNAEIAVKLVVSDATVKTHVGNLLAKLGLRDRVQAVVLAYETGLVRPGEAPQVTAARPVTRTGGWGRSTGRC
jgi:DNA-binding NarL/FixJ family response regulator